MVGAVERLTESRGSGMNSTWLDSWTSDSIYWECDCGGPGRKVAEQRTASW